MNAILLLCLFALLSVLVSGVRRVPAQRASTLRRLGRYRRTLGAGWHWTLPGIDRTGPEVPLIGNHLHVRHTGSGEEAELHYQITDPAMAGDALERTDAWLASNTRETLSQADFSAEQLKAELNRRAGHIGLRIVRCALHPG